MAWEGGEGGWSSGRVLGVGAGGVGMKGSLDWGLAGVGCRRYCVAELLYLRSDRRVSLGLLLRILFKEIAVGTSAEYSMPEDPF